MDARPEDEGARLIMCKACLSEDNIATTTSFTVDFGDLLIVIRNVPCHECHICGEEILSDEVSSRIDTLVREAKENAQQDVIVVNYAELVA